MKKVVRLTESDLIGLVKRVINEETSGLGDFVETLKSRYNMSDELVDFVVDNVIVDIIIIIYLFYIILLLKILYLFIYYHYYHYYIYIYIYIYIVVVDNVIIIINLF